MIKEIEIPQGCRCTPCKFRWHNTQSKMGSRHVHTFSHSFNSYLKKSVIRKDAVGRIFRDARRERSLLGTNGNTFGALQINWILYPLRNQHSFFLVLFRATMANASMLYNAFLLGLLVFFIFNLTSFIPKANDRRGQVHLVCLFHMCRSWIKYWRKREYRSTGLTGTSNVILMTDRLLLCH